MFSKRNRCFLKEAVGYMRFYTIAFTFRPNLDSTHEYKSKAVLPYWILLSYSWFLTLRPKTHTHCIYYNAAWIWNDGVYSPVNIQGGRGSSLSVRDVGQFTPINHDWPKATQSVTMNSADSTSHLQTFMNLHSFCQKNADLQMENNNVFKIYFIDCHTDRSSN